MNIQRTISWPRILEWTWIALLIGLPLTTFPLLMNLTGAIVAPFSFIPAAVLILFWFVPYILKRGTLPKEVLPYLAFVAVAVVAAAAAYFKFVPGFKDKTVFGQELRAFVTVAIGTSFYLLFSAYPNSESKLKRTLQWINAGGLLAIAWGFAQLVLSRAGGGTFPAWFVELQSWLSVKSQAFAYGTTRTSGLAYEASWYVHQLNILYLPLWLAFTYERKSLYRLRFLKVFTVENLLLALGLMMFMTANPRIGLVSLLLMFSTIFMKIHIELYRRIVRYLGRRRILSLQAESRSLRIVTAVIVILGFSALYGGLAYSALYFGSLRDWRLQLLMQTPPSWKEIRGLLTLEDTTILNMGWRLAFLERTVYWITGWHVFSHYPFLGVGLGNTGFFFLNNVPAIGWSSYEVRDYIYHLTLLPNTKSLWVRLLSETGITGFLTFGAWLYVLYRSASVTFRSKGPILRPLVFAGQLSLIALLGEGFSIDSFAMPYIWVWAGLISVAGMVYRKNTACPVSLPNDS